VCDLPSHYSSRVRKDVGNERKSVIFFKVKKYYFQILKTPIDKKLVNYSEKKIAKKNL
jgi:hypothetical protein